MGKRTGGFYPTDPRAVEALRRFFVAKWGSPRGRVWLDPAAGYGGLLQKFVPFELRAAIEIEPKFEPLLKERVPLVTIGNGLDTKLWPRGVNFIANPPYDHELATQFVDSMLDAPGNPLGGHWVIVLVLTTWARSKSAERLFARHTPPTWVLGHAFRLSCDGTGKGDPRTHDWLIWHTGPGSAGWGTHYALLPDPQLDPHEIALNRIMARRVEELFPEAEEDAQED